MAAVADRIELRGLRVVGTHGALPEEADRAQPFEVDLDVDTDLRRPGQSDELGQTVDYGAVTAAVVGVVAGPPCRLLEHLAERIATAVLELAWSTVGAGASDVTVTVTVRKLRPPVPADLASAAVRITRP